MSSEHWQQAKDALAEAMALGEPERAAFLEGLKATSSEIHDEVVSLIAAQAAADQAGFLNDETRKLDGTHETKDQYQTGIYDPDQTREYVTTDDLQLAPKPSASQPKDLVGPDYELEKKIGQGGMGVVFKAYHRSLRRTVALKVITGGGLRDEIDIARFHVEAEAAARLDHPGIIPVYDVGEHKGNHYYAMAYIDGPSLSNFVGRNAKPLPPRRAAELMEQVCQAVQYAHDRAVIHRDLKPANIMLENGEVPRLADFGLAKNMHEDDGLTMTGQVMGTPSYMAPEQATGKIDEISNRTDVYSLGATLYALLAGKPPFSGGTMIETIRQVVRADPAPLTQVSHTIPRDLQTICTKCLAKKPADRYASADDVATDLRRFLDGFPISARPLGFWARTLRLCQRNPMEASLVAVAASALVIGSLVSVRFGMEANRSLAEAKRNSQQLRAAMKDTFVFASEDVLAQEPGMQAARAVLLKTAQQYYEELVKLTPNDFASQRELAEAQFMLGKVQMAIGEDSAARASLSRALAVQQSLIEQQPEEASLLAAAGKTRNELATLAQKGWQALTQLQTVGQLSEQQAIQADDQLEQWQQHSAEVVRLRQQVVGLDPENIESKRLLASAIMNQGSVLSISGYARSQMIEQDQARAKMLEAQQVRLSVLKEHPTEVLMRRDLARGYYNLANNALRASELERQEEPYLQLLQKSAEDLGAAIDAYQALPSSELVLDTQLELAQCFRERAATHFQLGLAAEAEADYEQAEKLLRLLSFRNPNVYRYREWLAETQHNSSSIFFAHSQTERGIELMSECRATLIQALRIDPNNLRAADRLVLFSQNLADVFLEGKNYLMAEQMLHDAWQELLALQEESPEYSSLDSSIETLHSRLSQVQQLRAEAEKPESNT